MLRSHSMRPTRAVALAIAAALACLPASAQTLDDVLAKHLQARGGMDKIKSVRSAKLTGRMMMGPGIEAPMTLTWKRPASFRMEFTVQGMTGIQGYDGSTGWQVMPFMGKTDAEKMSEEDLKNAEEQADFDGQLVDWKEKGHQVELLGKEATEGTEAWKLKVTKKNGDVTMIWIDAEAWLEIRNAGKRKVRGQEAEFETSIGDYKEVGGLLIAHSLQVTVKGAPVSQNLMIDKVELNVEVPDGQFTMPEAKPAAAPATPPEEKKPGAGSR